ncbi:MAG TPA: sugar transferase [Terriglobales bacterium]|nr:sugar transferase [Terriglobales bacterium]
MSESMLTPAASGSRWRAAGLWWKRPFDLVLGSIALLVALPLICCLGVAVTLEDGGPALFEQDRVGRRGRCFRMWKLRTMRPECEQDTHQRSAANWFAGTAVGDRYKTLADPRVTRVGRLLRRFDLDELPQLFNVVRGDMSLVGPRPAIPYELAHYEPVYYRRLSVAPGMTGLWQVSDRDRLSAAEMMALDLRYVDHVSPWLDLRVMARTVPALVAAARRG